MKIEQTEVYGFRAALRAMRNPLDSWAKSDSWVEHVHEDEEDVRILHRRPHGKPMDVSGTGTVHQPFSVENPIIGPEDLKLACKLIRGGSEHRKFLRQIIVWVDFTLPRYVWQELDTYKVATVRNSCSTMHKLGHRDLTEEDFQGGIVSFQTLDALNALGAAYREKRSLPRSSKDGPLEGYELVRRMKAFLPESFLQRATYTCSYETLLAMCRQRKNHRLPEWSGPGGICEWIRSLPYMKEFIDASEGRQAADPRAARWSELTKATAELVKWSANPGTPEFEEAMHRVSKLIDQLEEK